MGDRRLILSVVVVAALVLGALALPGRAADGRAHDAKAGVAGHPAAPATGTKTSAETSDAKPEAKSEAKSEAEPEAKSEAKPDARKPSGEAAPAKAASLPARSRKSGTEAPPEPPGQGPAAPSPLTMDGLKQDLKRENAGAGLNPNASSRMKVEQLLAEMIKAREALHQDTTRLEAMALGEGSEGAAPAAPGAPGQPVAKNPLDVLAKALRGIKPEQAAPIVARIDKNLAATVLLRMPPVDAGKIMGALKPETAAELATQIALRAPMAHAGGKR